jgi:hypothetical protein
VNASNISFGLQSNPSTSETFAVFIFAGLDISQNMK